MNVYIYQAAFLCEDCGRNTRASIARSGDAPEDPNVEESYDSDDFPKDPYGNGGGESDTPQHCDYCNMFLANPLTTYGAEYVRTTVREAMGEANTVTDEWRTFYDYIKFDDKEEDTIPHGG